MSNKLLKKYATHCVEPLTKQSKAWARMLKPHTGLPMPKAKKTRKPPRPCPHDIIQAWSSNMARGWDIEICYQ